MVKGKSTSRGTFVTKLTCCTGTRSTIDKVQNFGMSIVPNLLKSITYSDSEPPKLSNYPG